GRRDAGAASCGEDGSERTIVIASCPTIPAALEMRLRSSRHAVTALVHAPPSESAAFSEMGRPTTSAWADRRIALSDDDIVTADTARDQAAVVVDRIGTLATDFGPDEISVCLGDPAMEAILRRMLRAAGTPTHHAFRRVLALTRPVRLLSAIADHMESRSMDAFAALVRHPDLDPPGAGHATVPTTWRLHDLDCLRVRRLSDRVPSAFANVAVPTDESGGKRQERGVSDVAAAIARLVAPLGTTKRPIVEWAEPIARVLVSIYDPIMSDERSQPSELTDSLQSVGQWLRDVSDTDPNLGRVALLTGPQALRFLVRSVSDVSIPEPVRDSAVEVLDWFETPYDDAPVKIVTTMNEGHIPARPPDDPLIPDALRAELGLPDAEALHALDAFHLAALAASTRHLCLISGRISADGDTLKPSRLLFACDDAALPARASRLFAGAATERHMVPFAYATASRFALPRPRPPSEPIAKLSVTAFRDYLACPYRFYLRHVLGLETITDAAPEMDAPTFGSLIHEALGAFARGPSAHETLETAVCEAMEEALDQVATAKFGRRPPPAVALQVTQARRRLRAFAAWQAERAAAGWVIRADWVELDAEAAIVVDDAPFTVHGRIDRIEHHPQTGRYALFDYKTGDTPRSPQQSHRSTTPTGFDWVDLQLPLYRRIAPLPAGAGLDMGYLWLGPDASADALLEADWSDADLALADVCADEVIRRVRNGVFWPPSSDPRTTDDGIGAICMDACADRRTLVANPPSPWDTA
ncbi:MAG: hypothetical protein FJX72_10510, partial [Armatimonadetes bacterium]|nr:hypothetical protein [Armatimonadota bacterium]